LIFDGFTYVMLKWIGYGSEGNYAGFYLWDV